jgi:hypothetical protein
MSTLFIFANNASSTLSAPITNTATQLVVASGTGNEFPNPSGSQQFAATLNDAATGLLNEIVYCTARAGDTFTTVVRGQEGTAPLSWLAGDLIANLLTAGQMAAMQQSAALTPARTITSSGAFTMSTSDANGGILLDRLVGPGVSSTTLPAGATNGQLYAIEDGAKNFNAFPVTVIAPAGTTIAGQTSVTLNVNGQCAYFRFYADSNIWSFKP